MKKVLLFTTALVISVTCLAQNNDSKGYYKGDINGDQKIDMSDLSLLINVLNGKATANDACKVNTDDVINLDDVSSLTDIILGKADKTWVSTNNSFAIDVDNTPIDATKSE